MWRNTIALLACALLMTLSARFGWSQAPVSLSPITITPYLGFSPAVRYRGTVDVTAKLPTSGVLEVEPGNGWATGATLHVPVSLFLDVAGSEGINFVAGGIYLRQGASVTTVRLESDPDADPILATSEHSGLSMLGAHLGVALLLPMTVSTYLTIAPAVLRLNPQQAPNEALDPTGAVYRPALDLGLSLDLPTWRPGLAMHLAVEDYIMLPGDDLERRLDRFFIVEEGRVTRTRVERALLHLPLLRLGVTYALPSPRWEAPAPARRAVERGRE